MEKSLIGACIMSPTSHDIIVFIRENPGCTSKDIAAAFGTELANAREPEDLRQAPRGMCYRLWVIV